MQTQTKLPSKPEDLFKVMRPIKYQERWREKHYVGHLYLVWQHREWALLRKFRTAYEAEVYSHRVVARYIALSTPKESRP